MSKRRGRKRDPQAKRRTCTTRAQRVPIDRGTPELQLKRALLAGKGDPVLTESPLGVLFARGFVSEAQHKAGTKYAILRWAQFGKGNGSISRYGDLIADYCGVGGVDDERAEEIAEAYLAADRRLFALGRRTYDETRNVAVFMRPPGWFCRLGGALRDSDKRNQELLAKGLNALANTFATS